MFVQHAYDFVVFCEDDMILAPGYMSAIEMMREKFDNDPRVGMVSANPGNLTISIEQQRANRHKLVTMGHNWGFGLFRTFWEKRQPFVDCYLDLIRDVPYRQRPTQAVLKWLELAGFHGAASSQDWIKQCANAALGACRLSTYVNYGLPIGRNGLHFNPELFLKMGFDRAIIFDQELDTINDLDDDQYHLLYANEGQQIGDSFVRPISDSESFDLHVWQARLNAGELNPKRLMPDFFMAENNSLVNQCKTTDISTIPHMEPEGIALLGERLKESVVYLEYGMGGSTVMAADLCVKEIHSVESDMAFLNAVKKRVAECHSKSKTYAYHIDIGPTKEWGFPLDNTFANCWPKYCIAAWDALLAQGRLPDLILIDGRFRVACFLASLLFSKLGAVILFDDYVDRPHYHVVEKHLQPSAREGRMAEFIVNSSFSHSQVLLDLMVSSTDPA